MPAPPEIRDRHGRKRITEIFRKMKAQHPSHTNGHIAVGAEIKIQLQSKGRRPEPGRCGRNLDSRKQTDFFPHGTDLIGDKHLLEKPLHEPQDSLFRLFLFYLPAVQLLIYRGKTDNRPRHQLRKHGYISKVSEIILFHRHLSSVKINAVAHCLKGKKTDPHRKPQPKRGKRGAEYAVKRHNQEVRIFKKCQHRKVYHHRTAQKKTAPALRRSKPGHEPAITEIHS